MLKKLFSRMSKIYAGPGRDPIACVYAGPPMIDPENPAAGPDPDPEEEEDPGYPANREEDEEEEPNPDRSSMSGVYAGPSGAEWLTMSMVYAGPPRGERIPMTVAYAGPVPEPASVTEVSDYGTDFGWESSENSTIPSAQKIPLGVCPVCKTKAESRFCPKCGTPMLREEKA